MVIQQVKLKSSLSDAEARAVMEERAPRFREVPGLLQKYNTHEPETGELCCIYVFDSAEALTAFRETELAQAIPAAFKADSMRVETYELLFPLHEERGQPTRLAI